ncbi:MAG: ATP-binding protein [Pseudomonadota bacterium]
MITRDYYTKTLSEYFEIFPIVSLIGPRQCGKTTIALEFAKSHYSSFHHFDLEDPDDYTILQSAKEALKNLEGLILIDEIQRFPALFSYLRVYADSNPSAKLLILGSSSPDLVRYGSESLAGRVGFIEMSPLSAPEIPIDDRGFYLGGFPRAYLASSTKASQIWLKQYISTFLEKDVAAMGFNLPAEAMRKVWMMAAHYHGNIVNFSELGRSLNVSDSTIPKYLNILESAFMLRQLPAWHENLKKRQIKNPKIYIRDTGILHSLLGISEDQMRTHPKVGAAFEGYALETIIRYHHFEHCYFWRTQDGAELDLLVMHESKRLGFEFKYGEVSKITSSMKNAIVDLKLDKLFVITNGDKAYSLSDQIEILPLKRYISLPLTL